MHNKKNYFYINGHVITEKDKFYRAGCIKLLCKLPF